MRVFRPNDAREGDVIGWLHGRAVVLVVEVDTAERRVDTVMLMRNEGWMAQEGERVSSTYTRKMWKRFNSNFRYLSRGWVGVLCPENALGDEGVTIEG